MSSGTPQNSNVPNGAAPTYVAHVVSVVSTPNQHVVSAKHNQVVSENARTAKLASNINAIIHALPPLYTERARLTREINSGQGSINEYHRRIAYEYAHPSIGHSHHHMWHSHTWTYSPNMGSINSWRNSITALSQRLQRLRGDLHNVEHNIISYNNKRHTADSEASSWRRHLLQLVAWRRKADEGRHLNIDASSKLATEVLSAESVRGHLQRNVPIGSGLVAKASTLGYPANNELIGLITSAKSVITELSHAIHADRLLAERPAQDRVVTTQAHSTWIIVRAHGLVHDKAMATSRLHALTAKATAIDDNLKYAMDIEVKRQEALRLAIIERARIAAIYSKTASLVAQLQVLAIAYVELKSHHGVLIHNRNGYLDKLSIANANLLELTNEYAAKEAKARFDVSADSTYVDSLIPARQVVIHVDEVRLKETISLRVSLLADADKLVADALANVATITPQAIATAEAAAKTKLAEIVAVVDGKIQRVYPAIHGVGELAKHAAIIVHEAIDTIARIQYNTELQVYNASIAAHTHAYAKSTRLQAVDSNLLSDRRLSVIKANTFMRALDFANAELEAEKIVNIDATASGSVALTTGSVTTAAYLYDQAMIRYIHLTEVGKIIK